MSDRINEAGIPASEVLGKEKTEEEQIQYDDEKTPDELIEEGHKRINQELSKILLQNI